MKLESIGNYVVYTDGAGDEFLYASNFTVINYKGATAIEMREFAGGSITIQKADVDTGLWVDENDLPFTWADLKTYLLNNTAVYIGANVKTIA